MNSVLAFVMALGSLVAVIGGIYISVTEPPKGKVQIENRYYDEQIEKEKTKQLKLQLEILRAGGGVPSVSGKANVPSPQSDGVGEGSEFVLTGPAEKVFVNSGQKIKRISGGDYKILVEDSGNIAWTSGYDSSKPPMSVDEFLSGLKRVHERGFNRHRVRVEVKSGSTVKIET